MAMGCQLNVRGELGNVSSGHAVTVIPVGTPRMFNWEYTSEVRATLPEQNSFCTISAT